MLKTIRVMRIAASLTIGAIASLVCVPVTAQALPQRCYMKQVHAPLYGALWYPGQKSSFTAGDDPWPLPPIDVTLPYTQDPWAPIRNCINQLLEEEAGKCATTLEPISVFLGDNQAHCYGTLACWCTPVETL